MKTIIISLALLLTTTIFAQDKYDTFMPKEIIDNQINNHIEGCD